MRITRKKRKMHDSRNSKNSKKNLIFDFENSKNSKN